MNMDTNPKRGVKRTMAHDATSMTRVQHPTKRFSDIISRIDDTCEMLHDNVALLFPILDCKKIECQCDGSVHEPIGPSLVLC